MYKEYWIKWENEPPIRWRVSNMDEFWHRLHEEFLRHPRLLEWMILE